MRWSQVQLNWRHLYEPCAESETDGRISQLFFDLFCVVTFCKDEKSQSRLFSEQPLADSTNILCIVLCNRLITSPVTKEIQRAETTHFIYQSECKFKFYFDRLIIITVSVNASSDIRGLHM